MSSSTFVKSTLILTVATLLSKILGSVYRIPLQNIAGDEVLGIFGLVYPIYMVALYLSVAGIPLAISKLITEVNTRGESHKVHKIYRTASILALCFGILSFSLILGLSSFIADMLGGSSTQYALIVVALTLLVAPYMAIYRGFFQGYGDMKPTAISQVIEQLVRAVLIIVIAIVLVKLDYSSTIVAGGVMFGSIIGVIGSLIFLKMKYRKSPYKVQKTEDYTVRNFKEYSATILKISIPIAIGSVSMALFNFVDSFTIPVGLRTAGVESDKITYLFGIYGRGVTLVQITTVFASSIILPLVPLITKKLVEKDFVGTRSVIEQTQKMTHLLSWPAALGLFALTLPLNLALFTNLEGSWMLAIINFSSVFTSLTLLGTGILQGMSAARLGAYIIIGGVVLKIISNIVFISQFGLNGAAYATLLVYFVIFIVNTIFIFRKIRFSVITPAIFKIIIASVIMGAIIGAPTLVFDVASWSRIVALLYIAVAIVVGAVIYFAILWFTKAINNDDLRKLPVIGKKIQAKQDRHKTTNIAADEVLINTNTIADEQASTSNVRAAAAGGHNSDSQNLQTERKNVMQKHKWLWGVIILLLLIATPSIADRWKAEQQSDQFEIIMPYEEIHQIYEQTDYTLDEVLQQLGAKGLSNVSLSPLTLSNLVKYNIVHVYKEGALAKELRFTDYRNDVDEKKLGYYISIPEEEHYRELIEDVLKPERVVVAKQAFYFLSSAESLFTLDSPIGYDETAIEALERNGLHYTFRVANAETAEVNKLMVDQLIKFKSDHVAGLLPEGNKLIGFNQANSNVYLQRLYDAGYYFYFIEGANIKGAANVGKVGNYDVIRLRSIDVNKHSQYNVQSMTEVAVRAVKERGIRSIFFHVKTTGNMDTNFKDVLAYLDNVQKKMPDHYSLGTPKLLDDVTVPSWAMASILLAGILFTFIAAELLMLPILRYFAAAFMLVLAVAYFALDRIVFIQAFALIIAVAAPSYAVIKQAKGSHKIIEILMSYLKAAAVTIIGIWIVIGLLNGNKFLTGYEVFRGVILVYLVPLAVVFIHVLIRMFNFNFEDGKGSITKVKTILNSPVRYWHTLVLVILAAVAFFYIGRTGNNGFAPGFEMTFRQWLEDTLYVRPRTKEFLIGFPMFVLALYVLKTNKIIGRILLIPAVIGFLSMLNTFTHLHISLNVSILRTVYGIILGFVIGLIFIVIYKLLVKFYVRLAKRWT